MTYKSCTLPWSGRRLGLSPPPLLGRHGRGGDRGGRVGQDRRAARNNRAGHCSERAGRAGRGPAQRWVCRMGGVVLTVLTADRPHRPAGEQCSCSSATRCCTWQSSSARRSRRQSEPDVASGGGHLLVRILADRSSQAVERGWRPSRKSQRKSRPQRGQSPLVVTAVPAQPVASATPGGACVLQKRGTGMRRSAGRRKGPGKMEGKGTIRFTNEGWFVSGVVISRLILGV
mmetsp:Transcript_49777/g.105847  ORF Transcript_49777/g.105847 Transcript_49777/m.105847 type:complete len:230 (+) Transcript_49777:68-757(+)